MKGLDELLKPDVLDKKGTKSRGLKLQWNKVMELNSENQTLVVHVYGPWPCMMVSTRSKRRMPQKHLFYFGNNPCAFRNEAELIRYVDKLIK